MNIACTNCVQEAQRLSPDKFVWIDVREKEEVDAGTLKNALWLPLSELQSDSKNAKFKIPHDKKLFLYCGSGNRSRKARDLLMELGYTQAYAVIEGGYKLLSELLATRGDNNISAEVQSTSLSSPLLFKRFVDPDTSTHTYLIADTSAKEAIIVDSVKEQAKYYLDFLKENNLTLKYLLETHVHADHVTANGLLLIKHPHTVVAISELSGVSCQTKKLKTGDTLHVGKICVQAISTPGHTKESMCFLIDGNRLLTGDTLLINSCGRTDFQAGSTAEIFESLRWISSLPHETLIYPGHDYNQRFVTTVGEQIALNPLLKMNLEELIKELASWNLPPPRKIKESVKGNLVCGVNESEHK